MLYILHCEIGCWHVLIYKSINLFHSVYTQQIKNEVDNKIVGVTQGSGKCLTLIEHLPINVAQTIHQTPVVVTFQVRLQVARKCLKLAVNQA